MISLRIFVGIPGHCLTRAWPPRCTTAASLFHNVNKTENSISQAEKVVVQAGIPFVQVLQVCEVFQKPAEIPAIPAKIHAKHASDPLHE